MDQLELFSESQAPQYGVDFKTPDGRDRTLFGGSFFQAPRGEAWFTVNLMQEHALPCSRYIPIKDFCVPPQASQLISAFEEILTTDKNVYVGCFGGKGRTGLFMACLLKYLGDQDPITTVREQYLSHAVETFDQEQYVEWFPTRVSVMEKMQALRDQQKSAPKI